ADRQEQTAAALVVLETDQVDEQRREHQQRAHRVQLGQVLVLQPEHVGVGEPLLQQAAPLLLDHADFPAAEQHVEGPELQHRAVDLEQLAPVRGLDREAAAQHREPAPDRAELALALEHVDPVEEPRERLLAARDFLAGLVEYVDRRLAAGTEELAADDPAESAAFLGGVTDQPALLVLQLVAVARLEADEDLTPLLDLVDQDASACGHGQRGSYPGRAPGTPSACPAAVGRSSEPCHAVAA